MITVKGLSFISLGIHLFLPLSLWAGEFEEKMMERWKERGQVFSFIPLIAEALQRGEGLTLEFIQESPKKKPNSKKCYQGEKQKKCRAKQCCVK